MSDILANNWRLCDLFLGGFDHGSLVEVVVNHRHVMRKQDKISDRQSITGEECLNSRSFLQIIRDLLVKVTEVSHSLVNLLLRLVLIVHPRPVRLGPPEILRSLQRPIHQEALLDAHALIKAMLASKHPQNRIRLVREFAARISPKRHLACRQLAFGLHLLELRAIDPLKVEFDAGSVQEHWDGLTLSMQREVSQCG